jgi:hypothetical protein
VPISTNFSCTPPEREERTQQAEDKLLQLAVSSLWRREDVFTTSASTEARYHRTILIDIYIYTGRRKNINEYYITQNERSCNDKCKILDKSRKYKKIWSDYRCLVQMD